MAISAVGEGCEKQMTPILGEVVAAVLPFCQDQVKREGWGRKEELEGGGGRVGGRREGGWEGGLHVLSWVWSHAQLDNV